MQNQNEEEKVLKKIGKKIKDENKIKYIADFPGLIDLVLNDDETKFLVKTENSIETLGQIEIEGQMYKPPRQEKLPPRLLLPKYSNILKYYREISTEGTEVLKEKSKTSLYYIASKSTYMIRLYNLLWDYHKNISELPDEKYYHLLVLWDFHTYIFEKQNFSPILYFYSIQERGKSRTMKGMIYVAHRGIRKIDINDAQLLRDCTHLRASISFDLMDFWGKIKNNNSQDVVLNRPEKGATVSRINRPEKGAFEDIDYYDVYGPTLIGTNEVIHEILESRAIPIVMQKSKKVFEDDVLPENALELKEMLTAWRAFMMDKKLPILPKIAASRLGDLIRPLHQILMVVNPDKEKEFIEVVKEIEKYRIQERAETLDAEIILASYKIWLSEQLENGMLSTKLVTAQVNTDKTEKEKITSTRIGRRFGALGFQKGRFANGATGYIWNENKVRALLLEFGLDEIVCTLEKTAGTSEPSVDSVPSEENEANKLWKS